MKITTENNSYIHYTVDSNCITIDEIKSYAKGDGSILLSELKTIASELDLSIELYAFPQDDTITKEELNSFYKKNGFELHPDDCDYSYFIFK